MNRAARWSAVGALALLCTLCVALQARRGEVDRPGKADAWRDKRAGWNDSFKYYGPNGLWKSWTGGQRHGRDTWIFWTGGNQKFIRLGSLLGGQAEVPISIEMLRMLDSRNRGQRFRRLGLINEPNCEAPKEPDPETLLWLDVWKGDPYRRSPKDGDKYLDAHFAKGAYPYYPDPGVPEYARAYGEPTGIVGLRKFRNPKFWEDAAARKAWKEGGMARYFANPATVEPPYFVGFSCAFCHMAFDPTNPPEDPEKPRWENLAANMGNQYFREGELFFGRGRVVFGNRNPGPKYATDPYDTGGLNTKNLLYHYVTTQQPGTSETSRISYDFINNPNTINSIFNLGNRPLFPERSPDGKLRLVNHVLKDGADSVGINMALLRVWINIFCEGRYWIDTLSNPATGQRQTPLDLADLRLPARPDEELTPAQKARKQELRKKYGADVGQDWEEAHRRNPYLLSYLASYTPYYLKDAPDGKDALKADAGRVERGKVVFARACAECHSSKQPHYTVDGPRQRQQFFLDSVANPDFLVGNTLSDDRRYKVTDVGTNMARAFATNAIDGDVWAQLSSRDYKTLPPVGRVLLRYKWVAGRLVAKPPKEDATPDDVTIPFTPPGGGRGYYRTPTLVSMWATAPYFHNNALGDLAVIDKKGKKQLFPNDGRELVDADGDLLAIDTSVEGRLKMFDDAAAKLLWPEQRRSYIKRTATDCDIVDLKPIVNRFLPGVLAELLYEFLLEETVRRVDDYIKDKGLTGAEASVLRDKVLTEARNQLARLRQKLAAPDLLKVKEEVLPLAKDKLAAALAEAAGDHAAGIKGKLKTVVEAVEAEADRLRTTDFLKVPRGTPVNLYFNLGTGALPYAIKAQFKYHNDQRKLTEALLHLSECPDLIEDKGHTYGAELKEEQKKDLIAFLKTL